MSLHEFSCDYCFCVINQSLHSGYVSVVVSLLYVAAVEYPCELIVPVETRRFQTLHCYIHHRYFLNFLSNSFRRIESRYSTHSLLEPKGRPSTKQQCLGSLNVRCVRGCDHKLWYSRLVHLSFYSMEVFLDIVPGLFSGIVD